MKNNHKISYPYISMKEFRNMINLKFLRTHNHKTLNSYFRLFLYQNWIGQLNSIKDNIQAYLPYL